jgi:nitroreductase
VRDLYLDAWHDYVGHVLAGLVPFSPLASDDDRAAAIEQRSAAKAVSKPTGFAETLDQVPVMLVVCADLEVLAATDRDLERYQIVGGASIYPFVWSILLAARERGLAGVMTTIATRNEEGLRSALAIPSTFAVASVMALGYPQKRHTNLRRDAVEAFTTIDSFDGEPFNCTG